MDQAGRFTDRNLGELVYYFSHHEKLCIVDNKLAAMGGLDACYGRWDTHNHPLADVHPTEFYKSLFPGQGTLKAVHDQNADEQTTIIPGSWISRQCRSSRRMRWLSKMPRGCVSLLSHQNDPQ